MIEPLVTGHAQRNSLLILAPEAAPANALVQAARANHRVLVAGANALADAPGVEALVCDLSEAGAGARAARAALEILGDVSAVLLLSPPAGPRSEALASSSLMQSMLQSSAGALMEATGVLLPRMLKAQHGTILARLYPWVREPRDVPVDAMIAGAGLLGALCAVAARTEGTGVRVVANVSDTASEALLQDLGGDLANGHFRDLGTQATTGPIAFLRAPPADAARPATGYTEEATVDDETLELLESVFRSAFSIDPQTEVRDLGQHNLERWDSLGHLKLMMEVEQALGIRLSGQHLGQLSTFQAVEAAVRAALE